MGESRISPLTYDQMERVSDIAEEAARKYVHSRVPRRGISDLTITVNLEEREELNIAVDVDVKLSPLFRKIDVKRLASESVEAAFKAIDKHLGRC